MRIEPETKGYYTVRIPFVPQKYATVWHPTEETGPFAVLTRGAFPTEDEAIRWGVNSLGGTPYTVEWVSLETDEVES